jgi:hypothetical protein
MYWLQEVWLLSKMMVREKIGITSSSMIFLLKQLTRQVVYNHSLTHSLFDSLTIVSLSYTHIHNHTLTFTPSHSYPFFWSGVVSESTISVTSTSTKTNKSTAEYSYQRTIPLLNLFIQSNPDTDRIHKHTRSFNNHSDKNYHKKYFLDKGFTSEMQNTFTLVQSDGNNVILCASSAKEKDEWVTTMETVIKQLLDKEFSRTL